MQRLSQDSGHSNFSYARYAEKLFTQIHRDFYDLYGDAMLVPIRMGTHMENAMPIEQRDCRTVHCEEEFVTRFRTL